MVVDWQMQWIVSLETKVQTWHQQPSNVNCIKYTNLKYEKWNKMKWW